MQQVLQSLAAKNAIHTRIAYTQKKKLNTPTNHIYNTYSDEGLLLLLLLLLDASMTPKFVPLDI